MDPAATYDALAPHYREYAATRSAYLDAVDRFALERFPARARRLLDVGAGDGVRGMALARGAGITEVVLCEPSPQMALRCRELGASEVWQASAAEMPDSGPRFEVVTCLWNVLGHMPGHEARRRGLEKMRALLAPNGRLFVDLNNRHNAAAYGKARVAWRVLLDAAWPDESRGDASFTWNIAGRAFPAMGHLFTPHEARRLFREAGLRIVERASVDYATGAVSRSAFLGQLVYVLAAAGEA